MRERNTSISSEDVQVLATILQLDLTPADQAALQTSLFDYLARAASFRKIDPGDVEPPVMTYEKDRRHADTK